MRVLPFIILFFISASAAGQWTAEEIKLQYSFDSVIVQRNGHLEYIKDGKHGLMDSNRIFLLPKKYDDVEEIIDGTLRVNENGMWFTINGYGECIKNCDGKYQGVDLATLDSFNVIKFPHFGSFITPRIAHQLSLLGTIMQTDTTLKYVIMGGTSGCRTSSNIWNHVNTVITHLVEVEEIAIDRFIFQYGLVAGDARHTVYIRKVAADETGETGPTNLPPPFPNLDRGDK